MSSNPESPPLSGLRVVELAAKGPAPFAVMLLADLGAEVVRVDRPGTAHDPVAARFVDRGRRSIALDLKAPEGLAVLEELVERADVLVEGYRPGVAERLGIGPQECLARNPRLVYARMTGWGQDGPLAQRAGHDLNFLAVCGALGPLGEADRPPPPPLNLLGDFGGGALYLALGVLAALHERERSGRGQVVDAAMVDGVLGMLTAYHGLLAAGLWSAERESNLVDGGAPWYRCYRTADGEFVAVGTLEPRFYLELMERLGLDPEEWPMDDRARWPEQRHLFEEVFAERTREEWEQLFEGSDACVSPVFSLAEAADAPHLRERRSFVAVDGDRVPAAAPRLGRTPAAVAAPSGPAGSDGEAILVELGIEPERRYRLRMLGAVA